jgi:hypothetical protein
MPRDNPHSAMLNSMHMASSNHPESCMRNGTIIFFIPVTIGQLQLIRMRNKAHFAGQVTKDS